MKVAVVIPVFNSAAHIREVYLGLSKQTYKNFTTYFVNDGSTDDTAIELDDISAPNIIPIHLEKNVGPSAARNAGLKRALQSGAEIILLLDIDCRIEADWVQSHVRFLQNRPDVGILGGAIQGEARTFVGHADGFASWFTAVPFARCAPIKRLHLSTTNMSIRNYVFEKVGLFDEILATGEDVDFCRRAQQKNIQLWFQSNIIVRHLDRDTTAAAKIHHYRWGLHSFTLGTRNHGGYYKFLKYLPAPIVRLLPIVFCVLNVAFILARFIGKQPRVVFYLPAIIYLKWFNARGVVDGYFKPELCLRHTSI